VAKAAPARAVTRLPHERRTVENIDIARIFDEVADRIARHGGRPMRTVTRNTSLVVAGSGPGAKLDRARALGIPVVPEREWLRRKPDA
jgi:hypothetical protein